MPSNTEKTYTRSGTSFVFIFLLIIVPTLFLYTRLETGTSFRLFRKHYARLSALIINTVTPAEKVKANGSFLTSRKMSIVKIGPECDGVAGITLLTAAILAFPGRLSKKFRGLILGMIFLYLVNLTRIIGLYYVGRYRPGLFEFSHIYLGQAVFIFAGIMFFTTWMHRGGGNNELAGGA